MLQRPNVVTACLMICASALLLAQRPDALLFNDPDRRFTIEFPRDWRWQLIAGSGEGIATFVHPRGEAAAVVERFRMKQRLAPADVTDVFAEIEAGYIRENQPRASNVTAALQTRDGRKLIVVNYTRPGQNEPERVRQFFVPVEQSLYRITCMAVASQFDRYAARFDEIAASLTPGADSGRRDRR